MKDQLIEDMVVSIMHDIRHTPVQDLIIYKGPLFERLIAFGHAAARLGAEEEVASQQEQLKDVTALVVEAYEKEAQEA